MLDSKITDHGECETLRDLLGEQYRRRWKAVDMVELRSQVPYTLCATMVGKRQYVSCLSECGDLL